MAYRCFKCGKGNKASTRSQHHKGVAGGSWKHKAQKSAKLFRANLHVIKLMIDGAPTRVKLCTDCMSRMKKDKRDTEALKVAPVVASA